jgi:ankyrin repeat protein
MKKYKKPALHKAAWEGNLRKVHQLVERIFGDYFLEDLPEIEVNSLDREGMTPLGYAVAQGHIEVVKFLLSKGVDVNQSDPWYRTPLFYAIENGDLPMVELLHAKGAKVEAVQANRSYMERTPLHVAVNQGNIEVLKFVLKKTWNVNRRDEYGWTPLHYAAKNVEATKLLLATNRADINAKDNVGYTPLHRAAEGGNAEVVNFLIKKGTDVDSVDNIGHTPLVVAKTMGNKEVVDILSQHGRNK